jgi:hypothetical protein
VLTARPKYRNIYCLQNGTNGANDDQKKSNAATLRNLGATSKCVNYNVNESHETGSSKSPQTSLNSVLIIDIEGLLPSSQEHPTDPS